MTMSILVARVTRIDLLTKNRTWAQATNAAAPWTLGKRGYAFAPLVIAAALLSACA